MSLRPTDDETLDVLLRGRVQLLQSRKGYRTSVDAMLLAWFAWSQAPHAARVADFGAGSGLVAITFSLVSCPHDLTLIERQASLAGRARRNLRLNGVRGRVHQYDLASGPVAGLSGLDMVMSNPPYYQVLGRILPAHPERRDAHYESSAGVEAFCAAAAAALSPTGVVCMVYPMEGAVRLVRAFAAAGLGRMRLRAVHHRGTGTRAVRVLLAGRPGPLDVVRLSPTAIHPTNTKDHTYTPDIEAFLARIAPKPDRRRHPG